MPDFPIYLDNNATTPCLPEVVEAMLPYFTGNFANASSKTHAAGRLAANAVELAREQVAALIGAEPGEIIFTSGATESNNLAIKGALEMYASKGNHMITCTTEHSSVLASCRHAAMLGAEVSYIPVNERGIIDLSALEQAIKPETVLLAVMYANNETGVIQPIPEISALARKHQVHFFTDAAQAAGKIPVNVNEAGIDMLSLSAHKFYGPKGVGALYLRRKEPRTRVAPQLDGGGQEKGFRSGTLNVPGIVGLGCAAQIALQALPQESARLKEMRDHFEQELLQIEGVQVNGDRSARLPHVLNVSFEGLTSTAIISDLQEWVSLSTGSACSSGNTRPSHVLKAMGLSDASAYAALRFSLGRATQQADMDVVIEKLKDVIARIKTEQALFI